MIPCMKRGVFNVYQIFWTKINLGNMNNANLRLVVLCKSHRHYTPIDRYAISICEQAVGANNAFG